MTTAAGTDVGRALIVSYLDAVGTLDVAAIPGLFHVDGVLDIPYAPEGIPRTIRGRAAIAEFYAGLPDLVTPMNFASYRIDALDVEGEYVAEYTSDASVRTTGLPYRNDYIARITVRGDRIARFAEFFDPIPLVVALGGTVTPPSA
ncbi:MULTISPECIES: nuclear transport factor 2 family protein [Prauserella salsuginis group]|uniref:Nuclear transport factor 2 family protein n=1 Tax=Prauserella salsuginis TaxID=387889 RepID=A0ABW6G3L0_9PSEU|nr:MULTISPECIES: nuclear transport factor 2 family protein [Prauserella salsuginis group]MCR3718663.1 hypothetical protein [Prauserella flava]MCR3733233.1 hypothetical protein [Prauserella salsuginis]